ncbi:MAG: hypothetical protein L0K74_13025 [Acidipropionibacterium acidipropionici]|nr:hypothetical protein [Acidipropionibacterium acidipropionici]
MGRGTRSPVTIRVDAGGREYSQDELDSIYAQRSYFTLHEMRRLEATLHGLRSRDLSEAEIDALPAANVRQVLLDNKLRLGAEELNRIYADQYREADAMWYRIAAASDGDFSRKVARAHLVITGVNPLRAMRLMARSVRLGRLLLEMEPDHIDVGATHVTEIMGMYGRPTRMKASLGVEAPIPLSPDHPWRLIGASHLAGDRNLVNAIAVHQARPVRGGLDILAAACFPDATPAELVDGHSIHMAIEFSNLFRIGLGVQAPQPSASA